MQDAAGDAADKQRLLVDAWLGFIDVPGLGEAARYEHARSLWKSGKHAEARKGFRALFELQFAQDRLPAIDADFREALLGSGSDADAWAEVMQEASRPHQKTAAPSSAGPAVCATRRPLMADRLSMSGSPASRTEGAPRPDGGRYLLPRHGPAAPPDQLSTRAATPAGRSARTLAARGASPISVAARQLTSNALISSSQLPDVIAEQVRQYGMLLDHHEAGGGVGGIAAGAPADFIA